MDSLESFREILQQARENCVRKLRKPEVPMDVILEPILQTPEGRIVYQHQIVAEPVAKVAPINASHSPNPAAGISLVWKARLSVSVHSLNWDRATLVLSPQLKNVDWQMIQDWFSEWSDPKAPPRIKVGGLQGVVRSISDPESYDYGFRLVIDLGSAPIEAFEDLVDCIAGMGFARCDIL